MQEDPNYSKEPLNSSTKKENSTPSVREHVWFILMKGKDVEERKVKEIEVWDYSSIAFTSGKYQDEAKTNAEKDLETLNLLLSGEFPAKKENAKTDMKILRDDGKLMAKFQDPILPLLQTSFLLIGFFFLLLTVLIAIPISEEQPILLIILMAIGVIFVLFSVTITSFQTQISFDHATKILQHQTSKGPLRKKETTTFLRLPSVKFEVKRVTETHWDIFLEGKGWEGKRKNLRIWDYSYLPTRTHEYLYLYADKVRAKKNVKTLNEILSETYVPETDLERLRTDMKITTENGAVKATFRYPLTFTIIFLSSGMIFTMTAILLAILTGTEEIALIVTFSILAITSTLAGIFLLNRKTWILFNRPKETVEMWTISWFKKRKILELVAKTAKFKIKA